jgi:hypothetical protein
VGDGLLWHGVLLGLADCVIDLALLQSHGLLQNHLDGRAHVEEKIMGTGEQRDRSDAARC